MCQEKNYNSIKEKVLEKTVKTIRYLPNYPFITGPIRLAGSG